MSLSRTTKQLAAAVVAVSVPVVAAVVNAVREPWRPTGDYALIALRTMDVPGDLPLSGVYSRFGFHHPGPALFLTYAVPSRLLGPTGLLVAAGLVNLAAVIATVVMLRRRGGATLLVLGTLGLVTLELAAAAQLADPWNPWVPMLPFALAIVLAWSVWERDWWALPALVVVLSFVVQAHLGYLALAAWLTGAAALAVVASWARRRDQPPCPPRVILWSAGLGLVAWALPLWDLVTGDPGNLRVITEHFLHSTETTVGATESARLLGRELGWLPPALGGREPIMAFLGSIEGRSPLAALPFLVLVGGAAVLAARARDRAPLHLLALLGGCLAVGWFSIARFEGGAYPYLIRWMWPIVMLTLTAAAWAYAHAARRLLAARAADHDGGPPPAGTRRVLLGVGVVLVAIVATSATVSAGRAPLPNAAFDRAVRQLADPVADAVRERGTVLLGHASGTWGEEEAGLAAELWRRGIPLYVPDPQGFEFGASRTIGGRGVEGVLVLASGPVRDARRAGDLPTGSVLVASYDPLDPDERARADALTQQAAEEFAATAAGTPVTDPMSRVDRDLLDGYTERGRPVDVYLDPAP